VFADITSFRPPPQRISSLPLPPIFFNRFRFCQASHLPFPKATLRNFLIILFLFPALEIWTPLCPSLQFRFLNPPPCKGYYFFGVLRFLPPAQGLLFSPLTLPLFAFFEGALKGRNVSSFSAQLPTYVGVSQRSPIWFEKNVSCGPSFFELFECVLVDQDSMVG